MLALGAACSGTRNLIAPDDSPGTGSGQSRSVDPLIGSWEATLIVTVDTDIQSWTTRWVLQTGGQCSFQQTIRSVLEGTTTVRDRPCLWSTANGRLRIEYTDTGAVLESSFEFIAANPDRLRFQDVEYRRVTEA